jgi:hypothetical protein
VSEFQCLDDRYFNENGFKDAYKGRISKRKEWICSNYYKRRLNDKREPGPRTDFLGDCWKKEVNNRGRPKWFIKSINIPVLPGHIFKARKASP